MLSRKKFIACTLLVALCGLSVSAIIGWNLHDRQPRRLTAAAWKDKFRSTEELVKGVDVVVLAQAVAVNPGRVAYSANGEDALPFEVVEFTAINGLKGTSDGAPISVERVGGGDNDQSIYFGDDGGPVEIGGTYLLFLKKQEDGPYYYQVNNQGRFRVEGGRLRAADPEDEVAASLHGRGLGEVMQAIRKTARGQ
jgi:hypothetical protein